MADVHRRDNPCSVVGDVQAKSRWLKGYPNPNLLSLAMGIVNDSLLRDSISILIARWIQVSDKSVCDHFEGPDIRHGEVLAQSLS